MSRINAFASLGSRLAVGGTFTQGLSGYNVVTWDGATIGTLDIGLDGGVRAPWWDSPPASAPCTRTTSWSGATSSTREARPPRTSRNGPNLT